MSRRGRETRPTLGWNEGKDGTADGRLSKAQGRGSSLRPSASSSPLRAAIGFLRCCLSTRSERSEAAALLAPASAVSSVRTEASPLARLEEAVASPKPASWPSEREKGSSSDADDDGVVGIPPTLFTLSEAVDPCVKLVISENAEGEIGSNCIAGPSRPAAGASSSPESLDERAASCKPGRATA